jgi:hypothetical protein
MTFDWNEYLTLAQFLQRHSEAGINQESAHRSAVSRAYFAAFCHARNYARDRHGLNLTYTGDDHSLVMRHFRFRKAKGVAIKLDMLRKWRNRCDYEDSVDDLSIILASAILEAQKVIAILK